MTVPTIALNDGHRIPQLGFGVFLVDPGQARTHRLGRAGGRATGTSTPPPATRTRRASARRSRPAGSPRDELFVTTKLWNADQGYDATLRAFDASLDRLGLDYVDLYLIHWPTPKRDLYVETWQALEQISGDGRARVDRRLQLHRRRT